MARITVEDCLKKVESQYDLVLLAKERTSQLNSGAEMLVEADNDKNTVIALREIGDGKITIEELKNNSIARLRKEPDSNPEEEDEIRKLKTLSPEEKASTIENILSKVRNYGAIEKAYEIAETYAQKGIEAIETSPKGPARDSLENIAHFVIERKI